MIYPILIGLGVVAYMIINETDGDTFSYINFTAKSLFWLFVAVLFMVGRDLGYIIRIKVLSDGQLSWAKAFRIIMLWEFTSAVTPSAIGGTSFAIIYVNKEGIGVGKSSAMVLLTSFFDELYFILMFPLLILVVGGEQLFSVSSAMASSIVTFAVIGYSLKLLYLIFISYGLFLNPAGLKWVIVNIFRLPFLSRWFRDAVRAGNDIITSSKEIKSKGAAFWAKVLSATFLSWSSRYLVVNAIMLAFFSFSDHILLFARQLVMWIMMLVMPTPGGSGFSEYLFKEYLGDFIPLDPAMQVGVAAVLALVWRLVTYYPYLVIGAIMLPRWIRRNFIK